MVPNGWVRHLGSEITTKITKGSSPKWQGFDYQSEGTLFVTSENVRDGFLDVSKPKYLPLEFNQKLKNSQLQQGDILINIVGASIGRSCQYDLSEQQANINQAVCLFRTNELAESDFIQQYLQLPSTINRLLGTQSESARPNLSLTDMRDFLFALPPLPEQRKIAKTLSTWDKAISTTEKLIETSKQQKKALMQQLLTGKKRLINPETGKAFEGKWEEVRLIDTANKEKYSFTGGPFGSDLKSSDYTESGVRIIQLQNIGDGCFHNSYKIFTSEEKADELSSCNIFPEDIIISKMGDPVARATLIPDFHHRYVMASDGIRLAVNKHRFNNSFVLEVINFENFRNTALSKSTGSTRKRIGLTDLKNIKLRAPQLIEQKRIASVLTAADKEIEVFEAKLAHFKQEKKALMQQLLTGKRRVKVAETESA